MGTLMPERINFIEESNAALDEVDLGRPSHWREKPKIGSVPLTASGTPAQGQGMRQLGQAEFELARQLIGG